MQKYFSFGGIIDGKVRVNYGYVMLGSATPQRIADGSGQYQDVTVAGGSSASPQYGVLEFYVVGGSTPGTGKILDTTQGTFPKNDIAADTTTARRAIFEGYLDSDGNPVVKAWCWEGVIDLTGFFAQ